MPGPAQSLRLALAGALLAGLASQTATVHAHVSVAPDDCEVAAHAGAGHLGSDPASAAQHPAACLSCRATGKPRFAAALPGGAVHPLPPRPSRHAAADPGPSHAAPSSGPAAPRGPPAPARPH